ncbi:MAG: aromatic ring-hydroxylating dioxygenase subunit alpha [Actinomycetota bacterium]
MLDDALVDRLLDEIDYELRRTGPPEGYPTFPDIPAARYTSEEFFRLEREHLWPNSWICAGRVEDLPENGSYFLFDELGHPLVVVRGNDGVIRCFSNTCRHRGAPVVREARGTARNLRCQYHAWTYSLEGDLVAITDERDFPNICKEDRPLPPASCGTWGGWIWVNMNPEAPPLLDFLGKFAEEMEQFQCERLRLADTDHRVIDCNWKVAIEAFQEVYHFRFIHDRGGFTNLNSRGATMGLLANGNSRMVVPFSKQTVDALGRSSWRELAKLPEQPGMPQIPSVHPIVHSTSYSFTVFPNLITPVAATGFPIMLFFPDGPGRTIIRIYHFAPDWEGDEHTTAMKERYAGFATIIDEDVENMNPMHRAMGVPGFDGVPLSYQERRIWHFNETIDRTIGVERIAEDLRVPQLLGDFIETG